MTLNGDLPPVTEPAEPPVICEIPVPTQVGPFRVLSVLGRGGMGVVYRARQDQPPRPVALKMLTAERNTADLRRRFEHETAVLARLTHPGIAQIFTAGVAPESTGQPYFAMELIDGLPLTVYARNHRLDARDQIELVLQVCDAVQYAHQQGVVHRDLKPGNVLVDPAARVKVLDFGVAKLVGDDTASPATRETRLGDVVGTIEYMSPEQAAGRSDDVDTRCDVYAIGVLLYELLGGRLPFDFADRGPAARFDMILHQEPPRLGVLNPLCRGDVETIVAKAMNKDKVRRYASVSELAADLRRYLEGRPVEARRPALWYLLARAAQRNKLLVASAAALVLALTAGVIGTAIGLAHAQQAAVKERKAKDEQGKLAEHNRVLLAESKQQLARMQMERGQAAEAAVSLAEALDAGHPHPGEVRFQRAEALLTLQRTEECARELDELETHPNMEHYAGRLLLLRGELLMSRDNEAAMALIKQALSRGLDDPAEEAFARGFLAENALSAISQWEQVLRLKPFRARAREMLAMSYFVLGRRDEAQQLNRVSLMFYPNMPTFWLLEGLLRARAGDRSGVKECIDHLEPQLSHPENLQLARDVFDLVGLSIDFERLIFDDAYGIGIRQALLKVPAILVRFGLKEGQGPLPIQFPPWLAKAGKRIGLEAVAANLFSLAAFLNDSKKQEVTLKNLAQEVPEGTVYYAYGQLLFAQGRFEEAIPRLRQATDTPSVFGESPSIAARSMLAVSEWAVSKPNAFRPNVREDRAGLERSRQILRERLRRGPITQKGLADVMLLAAQDLGDFPTCYRIIEDQRKLGATEIEVASLIIRTARKDEDWLVVDREATRALRILGGQTMEAKPFTDWQQEARAKLKEQAKKFEQP